MGRTNARPWLPWLAGLLAVTLAVYWPAMDNEFVNWDDGVYVIDNQLVRGEEAGLSDIFSTPVSLNYHPLTILSMRWNNNDCADCPDGISPMPFIAGNILLHLLNTVLVLLLLLRLFPGSWKGALLGAGIFALHFMHVESVAWVSERKDVLYVFFLLAAWLAWLESGSGVDKRWYAASLLLFLAACLSKGMAVVLPLLLLAHSWFDSTRKSNGSREFTTVVRSQLPLLIPFFAVSLLFGLIALNLQSGGNFGGFLNHAYEMQAAIVEGQDYGLLQRIQIGLYGIGQYVFRFFWPFGSVPFYPYPTPENLLVGLQFYAFPLLAIGLMVLAVITCRTKPVYLFATAVFLISLILVLQFLSVGGAIIANRYTYLAYLAFCLFPAFWESRMAPGDFRKLQLGLLLFLLYLAVFSRKEVGIWQNSETLWTTVIERYPSETTSRINRGNYLSEKAASARSAGERNKLLQTAMQDFELLVSKGIRNADAFEGVGKVYGMLGEMRKSEIAYDSAIAIRPDDGKLYYNRGISFHMQERYEEAIRDYTYALERENRLRLEILNYRASALLNSYRLELAVKDLDELIGAQPGNTAHLLNRGLARGGLGDFDGARKDFEEVLRLDPGNTTAREQLARLQQAARPGVPVQD